MNQKAQFNTLEEIMQMDFPEDRQIRRIRKPDAIRCTLDDFRCDIHLSSIRTEADILSWSFYLANKRCMTAACLARFISLAADAKGFDLHSDLKDHSEPSPLDIWFLDHQEITIQQFADLEGISTRAAAEKLSRLAKKRKLFVSRTMGRKKFYALKTGQNSPVKRA